MKSVRSRISTRVVLLNAGLAALSALFALQLARDLSARRPVPPPRSPAAAQPAPVLDGPAQARAAVARKDDLGPYSVVATKNIFSPSRSEPSNPAPTPAARGQVGSIRLHGVVVSDGASRAFLDDPVSKRVFGYTVGDRVADGRIERITPDRVVIARPDGPMEILLRDPSKPRPVVVASEGQPAAAEAAPATRSAAAGGPSGGMEITVTQALNGWGPGGPRTLSRASASPASTR